MGTGANVDNPDASELGAQLRSTIAQLYRRFRNQRTDGDLGDATLRVLSYLDKHGPQTLTELSDYDRVSPASMSQIVNRLTSAGYASRGPDAHDRRKVLFHATAEGAAVAVAARAERNEWLDAQLSKLSAHERRTLARASSLLRDIAEN